MKLQSLLENFTSQLSPNEICLESNFWCLPIHTIQVSYTPVLRRQMDILMKTLLHSVQKAKFHSAVQLSDILLVEPLFVQDLLSKMEKMGLIERNDQTYQIKEKGIAQLKSGIYEEQQEVKTANLLYSSTHQHFLTGDLDEVLEYEDFPEPIYRHYQQIDEPIIPQELLVEELQLTLSYEQDEESSNLHITSYDQIEYEQINDIPCIEMLVMDQKTNTISVRIWNTLLDEWDKELENKIAQLEKGTWKEKIKQ